MAVVMENLSDHLNNLEKNYRDVFLQYFREVNQLIVFNEACEGLSR